MRRTAVNKFSKHGRQKPKAKTPWEPAGRRVNAKPIQQDFNIIESSIPSIVTCNLFDPDLSHLKSWASDANRLFSLESVFVKPSVFDYKLPSHGNPEFAFIGRSNVGKSSLVNALLGNGSKLAYISKEPGCTRSVNFFAFVKDSEVKNDIHSSIAGHVMYLVDLPGYGFAKASKKDQESWQAHIDNYIMQRDPSILR